VTVPDLLEPSRTAVLLMDYQNGVVDRFAGTDSELLARAAAAISTARAAGAVVGYVRVALDPDEAAAVPDTNKTFRAVASRGSMGPDDPATAVADPIAPRDGDIVVRKKRVGAFSTTDLDVQLRERGIDTLVLGGISTSGVVLSTVRDAADRDYRIVLLEDLCVDQDDEVHRVLLTKVFPRQADVVTSDRLADLLAGRH
jgi:nicotinamidase-related amidase